MRHFLLAAVLVVLATASVAESAKTPRRGGGPAVVPPSFFENTSVRTLVTDGFCSGGHNVVNAGPAVHDQKVFIAYGKRPANGLSCIGNAFDVKAFRAWNYSDGSGVTGMVTVDTVQVFFGTGGHDMPAIVASSNGTESVIYGGEQLGLCCPPAHAPGVKETTVADDTSSFGSMTRVPISGGTSENVCGYDTNGTLHCVGQKQSIASGGTDRGFDLVYYRRTASGTWQLSTDAVSSWIVRKGSSADGSGTNGAPGCIPNSWNKGTTVYIIFTRAFDSCRGSYKDIHILKSTDGGDNFCYVDGTNCFARTTGYTGSYDGIENTYPRYRLFTGTVASGMAVAVLSNGNPVVVFGTTTALVSRVWNGSSWTTATIDSNVTNHPHGVAVAVNSRDVIRVYAASGDSGVGAVKEYSSSNNGTSYSATTLQADNGLLTRSFNARVFSSLGGKERILVTWVECGSNNCGVNDTDASTSSAKIMFVDRPQ